ncbi:Lnb N-terminal periplasmic domain-containing protein [Geotalea toluenoxydans]|uniref:Lnb N-terminal periplasmic domain-containing protein n=1 Tax=Geotalea toluenoxydans TaxID=421624 RepID=UPI0006D25D80|nr:DUF4105 domain-containing protein [Geotalea toluenoxydans]
MDSMLVRAGQLVLDEERTWEVLLHYTKTYGGGYKSRIDDGKFFLAPNGRTDKKAELEATVKSFFKTAKDGEHTACRFPARYEWLKEKLEIDPAQLPAFTCSEKDKIFKEVDAKSAVLVFPVGHINSPASMFGHTLLRIDGSSQSNLVSYAANYAAITTDSNGLVYAWKGLFGLYQGFYSINPYYLKVKEYNDLEHRDMWEYRLKLSEDEVRRMLNHIWELQNIHSPYYFFDENCSYNLLFLIESARPELHLTDKTGIFVLPTNTINIAMEKGLLESARYRPSQGTRIRKILSLLDRTDQQLAFHMAMGAKAPEVLRVLDRADVTRIKVLDLAAEFVQFRLSREEIDKTAYSGLYLKILAERSRLGAAPDDLYKLHEPSTPETGHRTTRVSVGGGIRKGEPYGEVRLQPEFHALLDPDQGYLRGAQIKFLDTALKYNFSTDKLQLRYLHVIDIFSIAPRDVFFKPKSWKVNAGMEREAMASGEDHLIGRLNTGGGYAYDSPFNGIMYLFGEVDINGGGGIRAGVTAGPGISIGDVEQLTDWWKLHFSARGFIYKVGDDRHSLKFSLGQNFRLSRNNSINIESSQEFVNGHSIPEASIFWNHYF